MAKNAKTTPTTQGPSDAKEKHDYVDLNNNSLYNIVPARKSDSCSVDFYTQHTYDQITKLLQTEYNFKPNANGSAAVATTVVETKKVVLTLYRTKKLLIQGTGTWTWRNTVFRSLSSKLTICGSETYLNGSTSNTLEESGSECRQAENTTGIANPVNLLNKMLNKFKSPRSASTPLSSSPKQKKFIGAKKTRTATTDLLKSAFNQADRSVS